MPDIDNFPSYTALANALIDRATKDQLADVARLLALNIGWYQQRYGDVPQDALLKMVRAETLDDGTLALLSDLWAPEPSLRMTYPTSSISSTSSISFP